MTVTTKYIFRAIFIFLGFILIIIVFYLNIRPFGIDTTINSEKEDLSFGPKDRLNFLHSTSEFKQFSDVVYFRLNIDKNYDRTKIKVYFQNNNPNQDLLIGFQDQEKWSYDSKTIDAPVLNGISWPYIGESPRLYQKNPIYNSYGDFLANLPKDAITGFYNFDSNVLKQTYIPDYSPSALGSAIETPLRGKIVFYVYVNNEPFKMWVSKQDLNWYEDPDVVNIKIYKEKDVVYSAKIDDDGVIDSSHKVLPPMDTYIQNPGPGLPEPGVYKVVIDAGGDSIIKSIRTNLHKIVFDSPLNLVSNAEVYPKIVDKTFENKLNSDALVLSAQTFHDQGLQDIKIGDSVLKLTEVKKQESTTSSQPISEITIPKSDVILRGLMGYFAFSKDQFFSPSKFKLLPITEKADIEVVDYLITNYKPSWQEGEWRVAEAEFDLETAYVKNGKLSWIINAPGLKENGNEVVIKKIEINLLKKPSIDPKWIPSFLRPWVK